MRKKLALLLVLCLVLSCFAGCGSSEDTEDAKVTISANLAYEGNTARTLTYTQSVPMTLSDGTVITAGMLKPVWTYVADTLNIEIVDNTSGGVYAADMINTASTTGFSTSTIFGGNGIASDLVSYGTQGYFISLSDAMAEGKMPNFSAYIEENPDIATAITAYDGNIYHLPYTAEIGNAARQFIVEGTWIGILLDETDSSVYDTTTEIDVYYEPYYVGDNARYGDNGGSVNPSGDTIITKKTDENIIEIQNALDVQNGETLTVALIEYIERNYDYENPSELYEGINAAYDIDELVALFRCIKANPELVTDGDFSIVWPFYSRFSSYREDILKFITYYGGTKVHGSDSYVAWWSFDENGELYYTYTEEDFFDGLTKLSQMFAEGLIYPDMFDDSNSANHRTVLFTEVDGTSASGFMTFDWIASSVNSNLNEDATIIMPPVAEINGEWQYYIENTRVIKPDGWSISSAATEEEQDAALALFDYFFSEEGHNVINYGVPTNWTDDAYYGPDGNTYPLLDDWTIETTATMANGDLSTFLRDYVGAQLAIGYEKEIGMEYQSTTDLGFAAWEITNATNTVYSSYSGDEVSGDSSYYAMLTPPVFSLTTRQTQTVSEETTVESAVVQEVVFDYLQYYASGAAPAGTYVPQSYEEYYQFWVDAGVETYVATYQDAYAAMTGN
ncbi:MAG: hypothetical protein R3Y45_06540 [Bacillota bacterium]